jgi:nicotinamidase-related amidase
MSNDTALLIIDVQAGNFDAAHPVHEGDDLLNHIGALMTRARAAGAPIVYLQHCGAEGDPDEPGTPGWAVHPAITPAEGDALVYKRHPDAFQETNLHEVLKTRGVKSLVITGIQTEYCVDTTCRRAFSLGYRVTLVADGHSTWDSGDLTAAQIIAHHNGVLGGWFATLKTTEEITFDD